MPSTKPKLPPLYAHQKKDIPFTLERTGVLDWSDAGTGKTRTAIDVIARRDFPAIVFCQRSLILPVWVNDFKKFAPHLKVCPAFATNRDEAFNTKADVYITNHDAVKWVHGQGKKFMKRFQQIVVDEADAFRDVTSQRSKALKAFSVFPKFRHLMTGTPWEKNIAEVWLQAFVADGGARLGDSYYGFRNSVCSPEQVGRSAYAVRWENKLGAEAVVADMLRDITIRNILEECHDLPEQVHSPYSFELPLKVRAKYEEMRKSSLAIFKSGAVITAVNEAVVQNKLLQIASGAVYSTESLYHLIDTARYDAVLDIIAERKHSIVFFHWKHQRDMITELAEKRGLTYAVIDGDTGDQERFRIVQEFQGGFYRFLLMHPLSGAHGLTLTKADTTIWPSPTYNARLWKQGNRRTYRAGQTKRTEVICMVAPGTVEEHAYNTCIGRTEAHQSFFEFLEN